MAVTISFLAFNSCSNLYRQEAQTSMQASNIPANSYGSYLAGRIAHYRQDFDAAAEYYMKTAQKDHSNPALLNKTYLMLASQGRISEAAKFAKIAQNNGEKNEFITVILAADSFKQNDYKSSLKEISKSTSPLYKKLISPFINAWSYAGLNQYDKAVAALSKIQNEPGMETLYHFHTGMINDYFDKPEIARKHYEKIVTDKNLDLSVRTLEVICNFYIRNGEKEKASAISGKFAKTVPPVVILQNLDKQIKNANPASTEALISSPQAGLSEAFFNISAIVKHNTEVLDLAHIFVRMAIYENPHNDLARILLANILEMREMYKDAISIYDEIKSTSTAYYIAQYKKAEDLRNLDDYKGSELLLKSLILDYPNDYQSLLDLGDTLRIQEKYKEALKYYNQVIDQYKGIAGGMWQVYYALGITYERLGNWNKAEEMLNKALELNPNNLLVLNYLGYSWLQQNKHQEKAFEYIVSAYNQAPYNSSIIDSLGWAFYRLGMYDYAVTFLEKATDSEPSNAVINDHLGDAYWQSGRKNEARFQWNHALTLKDDSGEINKKILTDKVKNGMTNNIPLNYDKQKIDTIISQINTDGLSVKN